MSPETAIRMHDQPGRLRIHLYDQPENSAVLSTLGSRLQQGLILSRGILSRREKVASGSLPSGHSVEIPSEQTYLNEASAVFDFPPTPEFWSEHINIPVQNALDYANIRTQGRMPDSVILRLPLNDFKKAQKRINKS